MKLIIGSFLTHGSANLTCLAKKASSKQRFTKDLKNGITSMLNSKRLCTEIVLPWSRWNVSKTRLSGWLSEVKKHCSEKSIRVRNLNKSFFGMEHLRPSLRWYLILKKGSTWSTVQEDFGVELSTSQQELRTATITDALKHRSLQGNRIE